MVIKMEISPVVIPLFEHRVVSRCQFLFSLALKRCKNMVFFFLATPFNNLQPIDKL